MMQALSTTCDSISNSGRTAIVIPCYNEAARLPTDEFRRFASQNSEVDLIFVNDGSQDATGVRLGEIQRGAPKGVTILNLPRNRGKAEAVRAGLLHALEAGFSFVGFWDADLATPLEAIADFRQTLRDYPAIEWVFGSRVRLLGRSIVRQPTRHYLGRVFATATSMVLSLPVYDTQCGAKLFRVADDTQAIFSKPFTSRWIFDVEMIARLIRSRGSNGLPRADDVIYEYPLTRWRDVAGSKLKRSDFLGAALELYAIRRKYFSSRSTRA